MMLSVQLGDVSMCHSGVIHEGDELLEINGIPVVGKTTEQIGKLMVSHRAAIEQSWRRQSLLLLMKGSV